MKQIKLILFFLVLFLGVFLRSTEVINKNPLFGFDQGRDYLAVRKIVVEKKPTLIGAEAGAGFAGLRGIFHGPYYYYLLTLPFLIFRGDPYGGLVLMFIFGVASLLLCFFLVYKHFGFKAALVAVLLMNVALSAQSRFVWNPHPATFFILLVFWFVFKIPKNPRRYFFWAVFWAGVVYGFQLAISVSLIASLFLFVLFVLKIRDWKTYLLGLGAVFLAYFPFFAFEFRHNFMAAKGIFEIFAGFFKGEGGFNFGKVFKAHLLGFWFNFRDTFYLSDQLRFWLLISLLLAIAYFLIKTKKFRNRNFIYFLLILPLVTFSIFMLLENVVWGHYLIHLHLAYLLLFAFFFAKSRLPVKVILFLFLLFMLPGIFKEIGKARFDLRDHGGVAKMKGKLEAIDYLYQDAQGEKFNLLVFTPPVYDYPYQYLLQWYGQKKYGYVPGQEKEGLFYLLIEPDARQPWTYQGWLETVIKTGTVLKEEKLANGFIIQKRFSEP